MPNPLDFLALLTGRSQAAANRGAIQNLMGLTPPFIPRQSTAAIPTQVDISPDSESEDETIAVEPTVSVPTFSPLPSVGQEVGSALEVLKSLGVDFNPPPQPQRQSILQGLLAALPQALAVGLSKDPGAALGQLTQQRQQEALRQQELERQYRERRENILTQLTSGILNDRRQRESSREQSVFNAERQIGLAQFSSEARAKAEKFKAEAKRAERVNKRMEDLGDRGLPQQLIGPLAEAEAGLRMWTPELVEAYNTYVGAKARADLAKTVADTEQTKAQTKRIPLLNQATRAQIGRIGVLNQVDITNLTGAAKKKADEVFRFNRGRQYFRGPGGSILTAGEVRGVPIERQREVVPLSPVDSAIEGGRRAVTALGGDLDAYNRFLDKTFKDPEFAQIVKQRRAAGLNDLEIMEEAKGTF